jgi:hypothetical protein
MLGVGWIWDCFLVILAVNVIFMVKPRFESESSVFLCHQDDNHSKIEYFGGMVVNII